MKNITVTLTVCETKEFDEKTIIYTREVEMKMERGDTLVSQIEINYKELFPDGKDH